MYIHHITCDLETFHRSLPILLRIGKGDVFAAFFLCITLGPRSNSPFASDIVKRLLVHTNQNKFYPPCSDY